MQPSNRHPYQVLMSVQVAGTSENPAEEIVLWLQYGPIHP